MHVRGLDSSLRCFSLAFRKRKIAEVAVVNNCEDCKRDNIEASRRVFYNGYELRWYLLMPLNFGPQT